MMRRSVVAVVMAVLTAVVVSMLAPGQASAATTYYTLSPRHAPSKCVDVPNFASGDNVRVDIWSCVYQSNELWVAQLVSSTQFQLRSASSGKCLTVLGGSLSNSAPIVQYTCTTANGNGLWTRTLDVSPARHFINVHSGKCMDVAGAGTANGTYLVQYTCDNAKLNQSFNLVVANVPA